MNIDWTYLGTLIVVAVATIMTGVSPMRRTAIVLFVNWLVATGFVLASGVYDPWLFFIHTDAVAAFVILYQPAGRIQGVIGGLLITQIVVHFLYGASKFFNPETVSVDAYLRILDVLGYLQLILLGGWAGGHWIAVAGRAVRRRLAHRSHPARARSPA